MGDISQEKGILANFMSSWIRGKVMAKKQLHTLVRMRSKGMEPVTFYLSATEKKKMKEAAKANQISLAEFIRRKLAK